MQSWDLLEEIFSSSIGNFNKKVHVCAGTCVRACFSCKCMNEQQHIREYEAPSRDTHEDTGTKFVLLMFCYYFCILPTSV